jgi:hypothetical protein
MRSSVIGSAVSPVERSARSRLPECHPVHTVLVVLKRHWVVLERRHTTNRCADPDWSSVDSVSSDAGSCLPSPASIHQPHKDRPCYGANDPPDRDGDERIHLCRLRFLTHCGRRSCTGIVEAATEAVRNHTSVRRWPVASHRPHTSHAASGFSAVIGFRP